MVFRSAEALLPCMNAGAASVWPRRLQLCDARLRRNERGLPLLAVEALAIRGTPLVVKCGHYPNFTSLVALVGRVLHFLFTA